MGMLQARELAIKGMDVTLLEKGICGKEASWAGGGIISPLYPWRYSPPVTALATWSQAYYPNLVQCLEAESDIDPELTRHGLLMLSIDDEQNAVTWSESNSAWLETINAEKIYQLEPNLRTGLNKALWMPHVASIRNPRLLRSLRTRSEEHTSELQSRGLTTYAVFCLKKKCCAFRQPKRVPCLFLPVISKGYCDYF